MKFIDTDTGNVTYIQSQFSQVETDNDFENLGEVELKLKQTSLNDCEIIHFENEEDLFKQVVLFIQKSTENYLAIGIYQNEKVDYDITVLGYINRKKKWIKLKFVTDYAIVCLEED